MKFFHVTSLEDCKKIVEGRLPKSALAKTNKTTADAVGFVLAEDVKSPDCFPPYTRSTVDGFAIRAEDAYCSSASIPAFMKINPIITMESIFISWVRINGRIITVIERPPSA